MKKDSWKVQLMLWSKRILILFLVCVSIITGVASPALALNSELTDLALEKQVKVLGRNFHHGGIIKGELVKHNLQDANRNDVEDTDLETSFGYLFPQLQSDPENFLSEEKPENVIAALKKLGAAMVDDFPVEESNSIIPPVYTYWGQFIDHDITANTDRDPESFDDITEFDRPATPDTILRNLKNFRRAFLELDSVYGDGPGFDENEPEAADLYDPLDRAKLRVGDNTVTRDNPDIPAELNQIIPPADDLKRDLPRGENRVPIIGDARNDENLIVAQFHTAFLRFHNAVVDRIRARQPELPDRRVFNRAKRITRWTYQWLVVNDFLKTITTPGTVENILDNGLTLGQFAEQEDAQVFTPLEFSVAAYRFGHSMIRDVYDFNRNFGIGTDPESTLDLLFQFTGKGGFINDAPTLPENWIIEWDRFVDREAAAKRQENSARKIDVHLSSLLLDLRNEGMSEDGEYPLPGETVDLLKQLAQRNLLRGYLLHIPTGQSLAKAAGIEPLSIEELMDDNTLDVYRAIGPFLEKTPAWFYILKEAEIRGGGDCLGELGSRIIAETMISLLQADPDSYLNRKRERWAPPPIVRLPDGRRLRTIADFLEFAGVLS